MANNDNYWILRGVNSFGQYRSQKLSEAEAFFFQSFDRQIQKAKIEQRKIQQTLFNLYRDEAAEARVNAEYCLKCFVSNCIYQFCLSAERKYRETYGLTKNDLFPLLLDFISPNSITRSSKNDSLTNQIINTFDLNKDSSLSTWANIKVKGNKQYKVILRFYGIVEVTDWLILVQTTPGKLERKLRRQGYSEYEIQEYGNLLEAFHQVYRTEIFARRREINEQRQKEGKGKAFKPYPHPTEEQLKQVALLLDTSSNVELNYKTILSQLKSLANILRNNTITQNQNDLLSSTSDTDGEVKLVVYNQIEDCLFSVTKQAIKVRINSFNKNKITKTNNLILGLNLFYCQGYSMGEIATQLEFSGQSQVSRLLKLKELREDVSRNIIPILKERLKVKISNYLQNPVKLSMLDTKIQEFIEPEIQEVIQEAEAEVFNSRNRTRNSLLARTICQSLEQRNK